MTNDLKWVEINLGAIRDNLKWVRGALAPGVKLMAVVKADAYGHGAAGVAREAVKAGAASLGVLTVDEAAALRRAGVESRLHVLSPVIPEHARDAARFGLTATIDCVEQARALDAAASRPIPIHLDVDFGLGRWGAPPKRVGELVDAVKALKRLRLEGLSTHIDYVPGKNAVEAEEKLRAFSKLGQALKKRFPDLLVHAANSSVLMDFPHWQLDQVRVGNLLYGINAAKSKTAPLKNPWRFMARIVALRDVVRGRSIGYASEYIAARKMRVATLPVGYADGLTMEPAERLISLGSGFRYWGMLRGVKTPFVGRCGISHVLVDVTDVAAARVGDAVQLPVRRTAASAHVPRRYV